MKSMFKILTVMLVIVSLFASFGVMTAQAANIDSASIEYWEDDVAYNIAGKVIRSQLAYDTYGYKAPSADKRYTMLDENGRATTWSSDPLKDFYGITENTTKGWVEFRATVPENYSGETIIITVMDSLGEKTQISLYKENTFVGNKQLPTGQYNVLAVTVAGDSMTKYTCKASVSSFYLIEDAAATLVNIVVQDGISYPVVDDEGGSTTDPDNGNNGNNGENNNQGETTRPTDPDQDPSNSETKPSDPNNNENKDPNNNENNNGSEKKEVSIVVEVVSIIGLLILIAIIAFVIYKSKK